MPTSKKRKISSLSGLELELALARLRKLRSSLVVEEVPESDPKPADTFIDEIDSMIGKLELRMNNPLVRPLVGYLARNLSPLLVTLVLRCRRQGFAEVQRRTEGHPLPPIGDQTQGGHCRLSRYRL
jgi:hypothetical protein